MKKYIFIFFLALASMTSQAALQPEWIIAMRNDKAAREVVMFYAKQYFRDRYIDITVNNGYPITDVALLKKQEFCKKVLESEVYSKTAEYIISFLINENVISQGNDYNTNKNAFESWFSDNNNLAILAGLQSW